LIRAEFEAEYEQQQNKRTGTAGSLTFENYQYVEATALSAARFGLLAQRGGVWSGNQVIPAVAVAEATASSQTINASYGHLFWLNNGASSGGHQQLFDGVARTGPYSPMHRQICSLP
jgi:hypothetical protein